MKFNEIWIINVIVGKNRPNQEHGICVFSVTQNADIQAVVTTRVNQRITDNTGTKNPGIYYLEMQNKRGFWIMLYAGDFATDVTMFDWILNNRCQKLFGLVSVLSLLACTVHGLCC